MANCECHNQMVNLHFPMGFPMVFWNSLSISGDVPGCVPCSIWERAASCQRPWPTWPTWPGLRRHLVGCSDWAGSRQLGVGRCHHGHRHGHLQNEWSQGQSSENGCYTLLYPIPIPQVHCTCQVSKWWILDRYHVPLGSVGGTQPWRVKMSAMGVAVESREVARNGSSQLARLTWLWTWVGEHPQVIYLDQHFEPHPLCNGRMSAVYWKASWPLDNTRPIRRQTIFWGL